MLDISWAFVVTWSSVLCLVETKQGHRPGRRICVSSSPISAHSAHFQLEQPETFIRKHIHTSTPFLSNRHGGRELLYYLLRARRYTNRIRKTFPVFLFYFFFAVASPVRGSSFLCCCRHHQQLSVSDPSTTYNWIHPVYWCELCLVYSGFDFMKPSS